MIRSKTDIFLQYCNKKIMACVSLAMIFILPCRKTSRFGVLHSFERKIFARRHCRRPRKYWMYFKAEAAAVRKKIRSKPYESLWKTA